jgi:hypothetical protein
MQPTLSNMLREIFFDTAEDDDPLNQDACFIVASAPDIIVGTNTSENRSTLYKPTMEHILPFHQVCPGVLININFDSNDHNVLSGEVNKDVSLTFDIHKYSMSSNMLHHVDYRYATEVDVDQILYEAIDSVLGIIDDRVEPSSN